jgi:phosphatidylserine/phosphatidylglycerophosphate/cardiolipin synthase-like enzyme
MAPAHPNNKYCAYFAPTDMPIFAVRGYLQSAKKSIRIATYNMNVLDYQDVLEQKLREGVKIEYLVDFRLSFKSNTVWRQMQPHKNLVKMRVPVMRGRRPQMHNKVIIVDDEVLLLGSANWTYSGLVANYENVLAVFDKGTIKKFTDELDELRDISLIVCKTFGGSEKQCKDGQANWDNDFKHFLENGKFQASAVKSGEKCAGLTKGSGLLDSGNQLRFQGAADCLKDGRFKKIARQISEREQYIDGSFVADDPVSYRHRSEQTGSAEVYFSPEDNLEAVLQEELLKTLESPKDSFAYVSTNFITHPKLADALVKMHAAGVRLKVFFDRGRYDDPNFQQQLEKLKSLGFSRGSREITNEVITVFDNQLTGPYGCNHNKFAIVGSKDGLALLNGSANWSVSATRYNDENLVIIHDEAIAAIYLREVLSELFVYRYYQDNSSPGFWDDVEFLAKRIPCMKALLGLEGSCRIDGQTWKPAIRAAAVLSVSADANPETDSLWAWITIPGSVFQYAAELYTHRAFNGQWVTSVPLLPGTGFNFKFFKAWKGYSPITDGLNNVSFEWGGSGNDRHYKLAPFAVHTVPGRFTFGVR